MLKNSIDIYFLGLSVKKIYRKKISNLMRQIVNDNILNYQKETIKFMCLLRNRINIILSMKRSMKAYQREHLFFFFRIRYVHAALQAPPKRAGHHSTSFQHFYLVNIVIS